MTSVACTLLDPVTQPHTPNMAVAALDFKYEQIVRGFVMDQANSLLTRIPYPHPVPRTLNRLATTHELPLTIDK
jgi:hypothetical protein